MYGDGEGVSQDYVQAHMWLSLAAARVDIATNARDGLAGRMTPAQIAEAHEFARAWRPK